MELHKLAVDNSKVTDKKSFETITDNLLSQLRFEASLELMLRAGLREQEQIRLPLSSANELFDQAALNSDKGEGVRGELYIPLYITKTKSGRRNIPVGRTLIHSLRKYYDFLFCLLKKTKVGRY